MAARSLPAGVLLLAGCAAVPQSEALHASPPAALAEPVELTAVPFWPQEQDQCGPAALAAVLTYAGVPATPDTLAPQVYLPARGGSLQAELVAAVRRHQRVPYLIAPRLADLLAEVRADHPVLVLQNLALAWYPRWHYAVVVGYDLAADRVVLRSGSHRRHTMSLARFEHTWTRAGGWGLVVPATDDLPASATEAAYLEAVAPFEARGRPALAERAYRAALGRWPHSRTAMLGLGNALYALAQPTEAEAAYRALLDRYPDYPPGLNNLAQVLADQGRLTEAAGYAERAVSLSEAPAYRATRDAIRAQTNPPP